MGIQFGSSFLVLHNNLAKTNPNLRRNGKMTSAESTQKLAKDVLEQVGDDAKAEIHPMRPTSFVLTVPDEFDTWTTQVLQREKAQKYPTVTAFKKMDANALKARQSDLETAQAESRARAAEKLEQAAAEAAKKRADSQQAAEITAGKKASKAKAPKKSQPGANIGYA